VFTINYWEPAGVPGRARLYINGLPATGKVFLTQGRSGIKLNCDDVLADTGELMDLLKSSMDTAGILQSAEWGGSQESIWQKLCIAAKGEARRSSGDRPVHAGVVAVFSANTCRTFHARLRRGHDQKHYEANPCPGRSPRATRNS